MAILWVLGVGRWALGVELRARRSVDRVDLTDSGVLSDGGRKWDRQISLFPGGGYGSQTHHDQR
jgi:hypothetical protein